MKLETRIHFVVKLRCTWNWRRSWWNTEGCQSLWSQGSSWHHSCWAERCFRPPWCPSGWRPHWCRYRESPDGCSHPNWSRQRFQHHNWGFTLQIIAGLITLTCCRPPPIWRTWTGCWWGRGCRDFGLRASSQYRRRTLSGLWRSSSKGWQSSRCQLVSTWKMVLQL